MQKAIPDLVSFLNATTTTTTTTKEDTGAFVHGSVKSATKHAYKQNDNLTENRVTVLLTRMRNVQHCPSCHYATSDLKYTAGFY
jgi:hypothetical protein